MHLGQADFQRGSVCPELPFFQLETWLAVGSDCASLPVEESQTWLLNCCSDLAISGIRRRWPELGFEKSKEVGAIALASPCVIELGGIVSSTVCNS